MLAYILTLTMLFNDFDTTDIRIWDVKSVDYSNCRQRLLRKVDVNKAMNLHIVSYMNSFVLEYYGDITYDSLYRLFDAVYIDWQTRNYSNDYVYMGQFVSKDEDFNLKNKYSKMEGNILHLERRYNSKLCKNKYYRKEGYYIFKLRNR